jgi:glycosyltransferase 2 family protein
MRTSLRTILVVGLALALLAWFLRHADLAGVWAEIRRGDLGLLLLAVLTTMTTYASRSIRWQYMLEGLGPTRFWNAFRATVMGFAASFLLPARAGEFLRPYVLARREGLKTTATFATVILERVFDMVTVLTLFAVFLLVVDPAVGNAAPQVFRAVKLSGLVVTGVTVAVLAMFFVFAGRPEAIGRLSARVERLLPARLARLVAGLAQTFAEGLSAIRRPRQLLLVLAWSFPLWLSIAAGIWLVTRAFHIDVSYVGSFLLMTLLVAGVLVPTPGAVGGFHEAYRIGVTSFFLAPNDRAVGAAIVLHAISFVPVTLLGIVFMVQEGLTLGRMRRLAADAGAAEEGAR